jgi:aminopeptidase N
LKTERVPKKPLYVIHLEKSANRGTQCEVDLTFKGRLYNDTSEGLFRSSYIDPETKTLKWFVATHFRPNLARRVFPCFDEPAYKVPFVINVARHKSMVALSNMPLETTEKM